MEALLERMVIAMESHHIPPPRANATSAPPGPEPIARQMSNFEIAAAPIQPPPPIRVTPPTARPNRENENRNERPQPQFNSPDIVARPRLGELPLFNGSEEQLIPWLADLSQWPRRLGLEVLDDLLSRPGPPMVNFLKGPALTWFSDRLTDGGFLSFIDFQRSLLKHVLGYSWRHNLERTIQRRVEGKEPLDAYAADLRHLIFLAYMDHPRSERDERVAYTFAQGLQNPSERLQCLYRLEERRETTVDDLLALLRVFRSGKDKSEALSVAALPLTREGNRREDPGKAIAPTSRCFRCNRPGHHVKDCNYVIVPKKSILENGLILTFNTDDEKRLPQGTKFIRALSVDEENEEGEPNITTEAPPTTEAPSIYLRALSTIHKRNKPQWIRRDTRIEISLNWLDRPLLALFDCGADVTVFNAAFSGGAKMIDINPPTVKDASDNKIVFVGVSHETLIMGGHSFPTLVVWANISMDAILGMDVIGPWMLTPIWSSNILTSEKDPSIRIPFSQFNGPDLNMFHLRLANEEEEEDERMYCPLAPQPEQLDFETMISPDLPQVDKNTLTSVLETHKILFDPKPTRCNVFQHTIRLSDTRPVHSQPRRANPPKLQVIQDLTKGMLANNIILPSHSPYASPVHLVERKDPNGKPREPRFCVDYRRLNEVTVKDQYGLPAADDLLMTLNGYSYFAAFDLKSGFWQVEMDPASRHMTAFTFPGGLYEFTVMPFGLCNAPATFQRLMDVVLGPMKHDTVLVFMDDILIKGKTVEELASNCEKVFILLEKANLRFNPKKVRVGFRKLRYLGHVISEAGISPDPEKVQGIRDFPRPPKPARHPVLHGDDKLLSKVYSEAHQPLSSTGSFGS